MMRFKNKCITSIFASSLLAVQLLAGCGISEAQNYNGTQSGAQNNDNANTAISDVSLSAAGSEDGNTIKLTQSSVDIKFTDRDKSGEYSEESACKITLNKTSATVSGIGAAANGSTVTITSEGTYIISGELTYGQIVVAASDSDKVQIVLKGATINCNTSSAIYVKNADKVFVTTAAGTTNKLSGGTSYTDIDENKIDGVIFSKSDLTLNGSGTLNIDANYKHGIVSKDTLCITSGTYEMEAVSTCLSSKDGIKILDGTFTLTTDNDGIKSGNEDDTTEGNIYIAGGTFAIKSGDDAIHADGSTVVDGGTFTIEAADDGIHSDYDTVINGGTLTITKSYEGLEGHRVTINGGRITLTSSDDGINAAGGNDSSSMAGPGRGNGMMGNDSNAYIKITGGEINVNASGDGIDSNGSLYISGGTTYVAGPTNSGNGALDYNGSAEISGGTLIAAGASGMAQGMGNSSSQYSMLVNLSTTIEANTEISVKDASGKTLISWTSPKSYSSVVVSLPEFTKGAAYTLVTGSTETSVTLDSVATTSGNAGGFGGFGGGKGNADGRKDMNGRFNNAEMPSMPEGNVPDRMQKGEMPDNMHNTQ